MQAVIDIKILHFYYTANYRKSDYIYIFISSAKGLGREIDARVRIPCPPSKTAWIQALWLVIHAVFLRLKNRKIVPNFKKNRPITLYITPNCYPAYYTVRFYSQRLIFRTMVCEYTALLRISPYVPRLPL